MPYPVPKLRSEAWNALPDTGALEELYAVARDIWRVPDDADIVAAPGASALIAQIPSLTPRGTVHIPAPTYNEHAAAFELHGWTQGSAQAAHAQVVVNPNNPTGRFWSKQDLPVKEAQLTIIDESFCDVDPAATLMSEATQQGVIILKSFGKFWGLAGVRLGFAIGDPVLIGQLRELIGPWAVSGPALSIGGTALADKAWATATRARLESDSARLDQVMQNAGASVIGGTSLFRLYAVDRASVWQDRLARNFIWSRVFPYSATWLRLGLPHPLHWSRLETAIS